MAINRAKRRARKFRKKIWLIHPILDMKTNEVGPHLRFYTKWVPLAVGPRYRRKRKQLKQLGTFQEARAFCLLKGEE